MATEKQHSFQIRPPNFRIEIPGGEIKKQNSENNTSS